MESRRQKVGEDRLNSPSGSASEYSEPLPVEIFVELLSRLPVKSVAICRCVSKSWASMLRRPDFTELFFTRSSARPQFLFVCRNHEDRKLLLFSAPQPQNLDENLNPSPVAATSLMKVACNEICDLFSPIGGLFGFSDYQMLGKKDSATVVCTATMVCNPSTGQIFTLPKMIHLRSCVGYDPIGKEFKVLSIQVSQEHHVLTLGTGQPSWRMVQCGITHYPGRDVICINGVLYYEAKVDRSSRTSMIACFDVRTETYSFVQLSEDVTSVLNHSTTLVNYNGSLALFVMSSSVVLCVLEDKETHRWSTRTYALPSGLDYVFAEGDLSFVGVTGANEIVFSSYSRSPPNLFYVTFYSFERHTIRRVAIQGMGATKGHRVHTFLNHVENVKLMQVL